MQKAVLRLKGINGSSTNAQSVYELFDDASKEALTGEGVLRIVKRRKEFAYQQKYFEDDELAQLHVATMPSHIVIGDSCRRQLRDLITWLARCPQQTFVDVINKLWLVELRSQMYRHRLGDFARPMPWAYAWLMRKSGMYEKTICADRINATMHDLLWEFMTRIQYIVQSSAGASHGNKVTVAGYDDGIERDKRWKSISRWQHPDRR